VARELSERRQSEARLKLLERKAVEKHDGNARHEAFKLAEELAQQPEPVLPTLLVDDATSEKLAMMLAEQGGRIASMSPEGSVFDVMAGLYSKSGMPQFGVYLMGHSGDELKTDRVSRKSVRVSRPALTCGYAMQPQVIEGLADNAAFRGRGLLARFLYAAPESWIGRREIGAPAVSDAAAAHYAEAVRSLADTPDGVTLGLTSEAGTAFDAWQAEIEADLDDGGRMEILRDWGAKLAGATLRLAAVLHCVERGPLGGIGASTIAAAIEIARYLIPHAETVLNMMSATEDPTFDNARYLLRWIERHGRLEFTKSEAQHHGKRRFPKARESVDLASHLENYFAKRTDVKGSTLTNWRHTERSLIAFFGAERALSGITPGDAKDWERWLKTGEARENRYADREAETGFSLNTVRKRVSNAKQFFQDAVQRDLLAKNAFDGPKGAVGNNRDRDHFITRDDAAKVLEACPDSQWRLLLALSRYGGLRCPSEHLALKWADVNWAEGRFLVRSAKTAHHEGKGTRWVPLFPELRPFLELAWDEAEPGTEYVITRYRAGNANLRTQLERIIERTGLKPWPKLFQNLRASRATELANEHPGHVAAAWLGHSTAVASKHYWQVTDHDFARATDGSAPAAQKAAQQAHAATCKESQPERTGHEKTPELPGFASFCEIMQNRGMGDTGLEPVTPSLSS